MSIHSDNDGTFQLVVKKFVEDEGIEHMATQTHANVADRCLRTMKNIFHDCVKFNKAGWTSILAPALNKYNSTKHSSTKMTLTEAHKDETAHR